MEWQSEEFGSSHKGDRRSRAGAGSGGLLSFRFRLRCASAEVSGFRLAGVVRSRVGRCCAAHGEC